MNDFTKEELESIIDMMDEIYFGKFYAKEENPRIYSKIQSMIDDYKEDCPEVRDSNSINSCPKCKKFHDE